MIIAKYEINIAIRYVEMGSGEPFFMGNNAKRGFPDKIKNYFCHNLNLKTNIPIHA